MKQLQIYITNHAFKKNISAAKKFHSTEKFCEKNAKFEDFWQNNCVFMKAIAKNCAFQNIN